jgi:hypothetical protein
LKRQLLGSRATTAYQASSGSSSATQQTVDASTGMSAIAPAQQTNATGLSAGQGGVPSANKGAGSPSNALGAVPSGADHVVNIAFSVGYFEVCVSTGNHAVDHHEIDISRITSDSELFELIWDKYNLSRGMGLRRVFLRPRDVNFVMVSRLSHLSLIDRASG